MLENVSELPITRLGDQLAEEDWIYAVMVAHLFSIFFTFIHCILFRMEVGDGIAPQISWQKTNWNGSLRSEKMQVDHQKGRKVLRTVSTDVVDSTLEETMRDEKEKIT